MRPKGLVHFSPGQEAYLKFYQKVPHKKGRLIVVCSEPSEPRLNI